MSRARLSSTMTSSIVWFHLVACLQAPPANTGVSAQPYTTLSRDSGSAVQLGDFSLSLFLLSGDHLHIFRSFVMLNASLSFNSVHAVHRSGGLPLSKVLLLELGDANVKMLDSLLLSIESMQ